jgi:hypothetical protein
MGHHGLEAGMPKRLRQLGRQEQDRLTMMQGVTGAFDISVNDPASYTAASHFGDMRTVTGQITNLTFTPSETAPVAVPEPASLLLFAAGLAGLPLLRKHANK